MPEFRSIEIRSRFAKAALARRIKRKFSDWQTLHGVSDPIDRRRWRKIWSLCKRWRREQHQRKSYFSHFNLLRQGHYNTVLPYCILLTNPVGLLCYRKSPYRADMSF